MPDPTPTTPTTPAPAPATPATPSSINQKLAEDITRAEDIARTAQRGPYNAALILTGLDSALPADLLARAAQARTDQTQAQIDDAAEAYGVDNTDALRLTLVRYMQQAQAWARARFFFSAPSRLAIYHNGENLNANLPSLKQFSLDIRTAGLADGLAGFTTTYLAAYRSVRTALFGPEPEDPAAPPPTTPQPDDDAVARRAALEQKVRDLTHDSMKILFLADGAWPYWKDGSAGPRHAFDLPADRPYAPAPPDAPENPPA